MISSFNESPHLNIAPLSSKIIAADFPEIPFLDDIIMQDFESDHADDDDQSSVVKKPTAREPLEKHQTSQAKTSPLDIPISPFTVIVGRGKIPKENPGNKQLRKIAESFLSQYSGAQDKRTKTKAVNNVLESIRRSNGQFVKKTRSGSWEEVSDTAAREKIGYVFRDLLSDKYKSSSKSKVAKRMEERVGRASMKLERALRMSYPGIASAPSPLPCESGSVPEPENVVSAAVVSTLNATVARTSIQAPEAPVSRFDLFVTEELPSAAEVTRSMAEEFDFDEEELLNSPLINPEE